MIKGSCLCGKINYTIDGKIEVMTNCHCQACRKAHAAAFATVARVKKEEFEITKGEESLTAYESSPGKKRYFCSICGSQIYAAKKGQDFCIVRAGTLDDDPGVKPSRHIFLEEKAPWYDLDADIPRFQQWP